MKAPDRMHTMQPESLNRPTSGSDGGCPYVSLSVERKPKERCSRCCQRVRLCWHEVSKEKLRLRCRSCVDSFWSFWKITSSSQYLGSSISRRTVWRHLPFLCLANLLIDLCYDWHPDSGAVDAGLCLVSMFLSRRPLNSIWSDVVFVFFLSTYASAQIIVNPAIPQPVALYLVCLWICGVHSICVGIFSIILCPFLYLMGHSQSANVLLLYTVLFLPIVAIYIDYTVASVWTESEERRMAISCLLDNASHGFCALDPVNGVIQSASPQLHNTLSTQNLQGGSLSQFLSSKDKERLQVLCSGAASSTKVTPILVTCRTPDGPTGSTLFDVKIIPYSSSEDSIDICIQVQGERRHEFENEQQDVVEEKLTRRKFGQQMPDTPTSLMFSFSASYSEPDFTMSQTQPSAPQHAAALSSHRSAPAVPSGTRPGIEVGVQTDLSPEPFSPAEESSERSSQKMSASGSGRVIVGQALHLGMDEPPLLSGFQPTQASTCFDSARWLVSHWNVPKTQGCCCPWHSTLLATCQLLSLQLESACEPLWSPACGWQCAGCTALNFSNVTSCSLCGSAASTPIDLPASAMPNS